ncbi:MAG: hypothetical protein QME73_04770 [Bacillota bacterium]|nr:hypothetical protein [Bacillota bacterium]
MRRISLAVLILSILITGCQNNYIQETDNQFVEDNVDETDREYFEDEMAEGFFREDVGITSLEKHEVYKTGNKLNVDFYFTKEAKRNEISSSKDFVMKLFVLGDMYHLSKGPYSRLLAEGVFWDQVSYRAYMDNTLVLRENFDLHEGGQFSSDYYENTDMELASRMIDEDVTGEFVEDIKKSYWAIRDVYMERSYKGNVLIIKLKGWKKYNDKDISNIKNMIETNLAPVLEKESKEKYMQNIDYLGLVLQLYSWDNKYYEEVYFNGEEKEWLDEDWMNYDFFGRYINN